MKYWNKSIQARQYWTAVKLSDTHLTPPGALMLHELKVWCQQQDSRARFYWAPYSKTWYFENRDDAVWFTLNWMK